MRSRVRIYRLNVEVHSASEIYEVEQERRRRDVYKNIIKIALYTDMTNNITRVSRNNIPYTIVVSIKWQD